MVYCMWRYSSTIFTVVSIWKGLCEYRTTFSSNMRMFVCSNNLLSIKLVTHSIIPARFGIVVSATVSFTCNVFKSGQLMALLKTCLCHKSIFLGRKWSGFGESHRLIYLLIYRDKILHRGTKIWILSSSGETIFYEWA